MDYKDYPFWYSALDIGWSFTQRFGIKTKGLRRAQAAMGNNNTDNTMLRLTAVLTIPSSNTKSRLTLKGTTPL